ncbi:MAG: hypothetical protein IJQ31_05265 [Thermoguttaceae bacterium]|nr:hypothetical protein [Thermoguttaceae bacterium]
MAVFEKILRFWEERGGKKSGFMVKYQSMDQEKMKERPRLSVRKRPEVLFS